MARLKTRGHARDRSGGKGLSVGDPYFALSTLPMPWTPEFGPGGLLNSKRVIQVPARIEAEMRAAFGSALEFVWWGISCTVSYAFNLQAVCHESPTLANTRHALLHFIRQVERHGPDAAKALLGKKTGLLYVALSTIAQIAGPEKRIDNELDSLVHYAKLRAEDLRSQVGRPRNRAMVGLAHGMAAALTRAGLRPTSARDGALDRVTRAAMELAGVTASDSSLHGALMEAVRADKQKRARLPTFQT